MSKVSQQFAEGELVNVTIKGAIVQEPSKRDFPADMFRVKYRIKPNESLWQEVAIREGAPGVTVERVAPAEWPPQVADGWHDANGHEWVGINTGGLVELLAVESGAKVSPDFFMATYGPVKLVRRRGWTPAETAPAEAEQVDERAELVAGYRALADLIEAHPELVDLPRYVNWHTKSLENLGEWVRVLDLQTSDHPYENTIQHWADGELRGLLLHGNWTEQLPAAVQPDEPATDDVPAGEETPPDAPMCRRCKTNPVAGPNRLDFGQSEFCAACIDRCHESTDAFHSCAVCEPAPNPLPRRTTLADVPLAPSVPLGDDTTGAEAETYLAAIEATEGGAE